MKITSTESSFTVGRPDTVTVGDQWFVRWRYRLATEEAWRDGGATTASSLTVQIPAGRPQGDGRMWAVEVEVGTPAPEVGLWARRGGVV